MRCSRPVEGSQVVEQERWNEWREVQGSGCMAKGENRVGWPTFSPLANRILRTQTSHTPCHNTHTYIVQMFSSNPLHQSIKKHQSRGKTTRYLISAQTLALHQVLDKRINFLYFYFIYVLMTRDRILELLQVFYFHLQ